MDPTTPSKNPTLSPVASGTVQNSGSVGPEKPVAANRSSSQNDVELALLRRIAGRDLEAFEALYRNYHGRLFRFLVRMTRQDGSAEELLNDVMLVVWEKAETFRGQSRVSTWIFGIAYRKGLKLLAKEKRRPLTDSLSERGYGVGDSGFGAGRSGNWEPEFPGERIETQHELQDWLQQGLGSLPPEQRLVLELAYYLGYSCTEIAAIADCPVNTVKSRMFHARKRLRRVLPRLAATRLTVHPENSS